MITKEEYIKALNNETNVEILKFMSKNPLIENVRLIDKTTGIFNYKFIIEENNTIIINLSNYSSKHFIDNNICNSIIKWYKFNE